MFASCLMRQTMPASLDDLPMLPISLDEIDAALHRALALEARRTGTRFVARCDTISSFSPRRLFEIANREGDGSTAWMVQLTAWSPTRCCGGGKQRVRERTGSRTFEMGGP